MYLSPAHSAARKSTGRILGGLAMTKQHIDTAVEKGETD